MDNNPQLSPSYICKEIEGDKLVLAIINMIAKEVDIRVRRERSFIVTTTLLFFLALIFIVTILGILINNNVKSLRIYKDQYFQETNTYIYSSSSSTYINQRIITNDTNQFRHSISTYKDVWHSMSDEELFFQASEVSHQIDNFTYKNINKKVAFLFLSRGNLPLAQLWEIFFKGNEGFFSIYLHTSPDFKYEIPQSSVFYKRRVPSKEVQWGKASMIDAERRLLSNALLDNSNERFILLSETCIPLFNFTTIYNYLINSKQSYLGCFDDPRGTGRGRYNKQMAPNITLSDWRKGSQWFEVHRKLAIEMITDVNYYPIFRNHCMPPCYMDEHYFPTLVTKIDPQLTSNRSITWTDWSRGGPHPRRFLRKDVSIGLLDHMRYSSNCSYNGVFINICFLFARKFHPSTLQPLLELAPAIL